MKVWKLVNQKIKSKSEIKKVKQTLSDQYCHIPNFSNYLDKALTFSPSNIAIDILLEKNLISNPKKFFDIIYPKYNKLINRQNFTENVSMYLMPVLGFADKDIELLSLVTVQVLNKINYNYPPA